MICNWLFQKAERELFHDDGVWAYYRKTSSRGGVFDPKPQKIEATAMKDTLKDLNHETMAIPLARGSFNVTLASEGRSRDSPGVSKHWCLGEKEAYADPATRCHVSSRPLGTGDQGVAFWVGCVDCPLRQHIFTCLPFLPLQTNLCTPRALQHLNKLPWNL